MAMAVIPYRKKPRMERYASPMGTFPKHRIISGYTQVIAVGMAKIVISARNLPKIIPPTDTGAVKINWSVLLRLSSAIIRMERIGTVIRKTKITPPIA